MKTTLSKYLWICCLVFLDLLVVSTTACGGDETEADRVGVGATCTNNDSCPEVEDAELICLTNFGGGYCGLSGCNANDDCPEGSACVAHTDGTNYCFRTCREKTECNENRSADEEANCSANIDFVDEETTGKACVPPSSG